MIFIITIPLTTALLFLCVKVVAHYWDWLRETAGHRREARLWVWLGKGVAVPLLIWLWFNFRLAPGHITTMPDVVVAELSGVEWVDLVCWLALPAVLVAGSFWAAMTLAWLVVHLVVHTESRREILGATIWWGAWLSPVVALILYVGGWFGLGLALLIFLAPLARDLLTFGNPQRLPPAYTHAIERIKQGKFAAAEMEVIRQLEKREDDFEGWMMLAGLYANHFGDVAEAERTVREVGRQISTTKAEYCNALAQLAEWHLRIGRDREAARRVWLEICEKYPHSEFADMARRRINQLHRPSKRPRVYTE